MSIQVLVLIWLSMGFGSAYIAQRRGQPPVGAFFGGLMLPLALLAAVWVFGLAFGVVWFVAQ